MEGLNLANQTDQCEGGDSFHTTGHVTAARHSELTPSATPGRSVIDLGDSIRFERLAASAALRNTVAKSLGVLSGTSTNRQGTESNESPLIVSSACWISAVFPIRLRPRIVPTNHRERRKCSRRG